MDRDSLLTDLDQANGHIVQDRADIERQREIVARLKWVGVAQDMVRAEQLLAIFEDIQTAHVADRQRVLSALGKLAGGTSD